MEQKEYIQMTDQELLTEAKKLKSFSTTNSLLIGFLIGVIFYSFVKSSWGMLTLIPLYFIYKFTKDPKNKKVKELQSIFKERNLKW
jgi:riboflavin transporter FmnP